MTHGSKRNFGSITPLFFNYTPDNGATENNRVMMSKSHSNSWLVTNTTLVAQSEIVQKETISDIHISYA
jgi:hypothetical protein